jgi:hypothetical protein
MNKLIQFAQSTTDNTASKTQNYFLKADASSLFRLLKITFIVFISFLVLFMTSCKSCKCPAYSKNIYKKEAEQPQTVHYSANFIYISKNTEHKIMAQAIIFQANNSF